MAAAIVMTKHGRPVPHVERPKTVFGIDKGRIEILGDIIEPIDVEWDAETGKGWDFD